MIWSNSDANDPRVVESTGWRYLANYSGLEERSGVYIFTNVDHQVKYIGKAGPGRMVKEIENALSRNKGFGATLVKVLYTNFDEKAKSLERDLINAYYPPNNLI